MPGFIDISKASAHNLKGVSVKIPRGKLVVVTGLSGSGKSSLAFDTIFAEAQRRYMDTLSAYAKQFIGVLEHPEVESIDGLSPTIAIEQKSTNKNPRSTVGTVTEISDSLRLLYARAARAYSPVTGREMVRYSDSQIVSLIMDNYSGRKCIILSPLVKGRKGHYKEMFESMLKRGYSQMRVDGKLEYISDMTSGVDRYKVHNIELVIDKLVPKPEDEKRIHNSVQTALNYGKGSISVLDVESGGTDYYSKYFICPDSGLSLPEPAPHTFSFNSPQGACPHCRGLGVISTVDLTKIIPDQGKSIAEGGIVSIGPKRDNMLFAILEGMSKKYGFSLYEPISTISEEAMGILLYGTEDLIRVNAFGGFSEMMSFQGILSRLEHHSQESDETFSRKAQFS
ncbi:MAG: excinuclease ABC subunit UvrA, partial [Alistipes sp.]|nr:excinuclease ABC subunit UvrA [Candidatus Minthomonas equi]